MKNERSIKNLQKRLDILFPDKYKISMFHNGTEYYYAIKRENENSSYSIKTRYYTYGRMNAFFDGIEKIRNNAL